MITEHDSNSPVFDFPAAVRIARRVVIKPNIGYVAKSPAIVRVELLRMLVAQLLALRSDSHISIVEGVCVKVAAEQVFAVAGLNALASERVQVLDAEKLPMTRYTNPAARPNRFSEFEAPTLWGEADARISIAPFKRTVLNGKPLISASIKNLYGLLPRARYHARSPHARGQLHLPNVHRVIVDVYHTLGAKVDFGVVDLHTIFVSDDWKPDKGQVRALGRVLSGTDLPTLDRQACALAGEPVCDYLHDL
jgi:uncharacterized protein (DUF362 family)